MTRALVEEMVTKPNTVSTNLKILSELYMEDEHSEYHDFYLLWHAYDTLFNFKEGVQWYLDGINVQNFEDKSRNFFVNWLESA